MITITEKDGATIIVVSKERTSEEDDVVKRARGIANRGWGKNNGWKSSTGAAPNKWQSSTKDAEKQTLPATPVEELRETIAAVKAANTNIVEKDTDGNDDYPF